ncbi:MAG: acyltransferase family protein [Prevotella sp.]
MDKIQTTKIESVNMGRIVWVDWAKAILIYLMVLGHCFPGKIINELIYAFHMPAFFVISGYLYHRHGWKKTLKSFLVPVGVFSVVNFAFWLVPKLIKGTLDCSHLFERIIMPFIGGGTLGMDYIIVFPGVWFVIALLLARFLLGDLNLFSFVSRHAVVVLVLFLVFLCVEEHCFPDNPLIKYKFYRVVPAMPFVLTGFLWKKFNPETLPNWTIIPLFAAYTGLTLFLGECNMLDYRFSYSYILYYVNALCGSLLLFRLCCFVKENEIVRVFSKGTFFILAFNFSLIIGCRHILRMIGIADEMDITLRALLMSVAVMSISYYPIKYLLRFYPVLLGK